MPQSVTTEQTADGADLLAQGLRWHQAGQLASAQAAYRSVLEGEPGQARAWYLLGMCHAQSGEFDAAIRAFQNATRTQPDYFDALHHLGCAYTEAVQADRALPVLRHALRLRPDHPGAHYALGNALRADGQTAAAVQSLRACVALQPDFAPAHNNLGNALVTLGDYTAGVESLRRAGLLAPGEWQIQSSLGAALHANGQISEAVVACRRALSLSPDNLDLHANLAKTLWIGGKTDEARRGLDRAHARLTAQASESGSGRPRHADALPQSLLTLGGAYQALCAFDRAAQCFEQALVVAPDCALAWDRLGQIYWIQGHLEAAQASYERALALQPDLCETQVRLSHVFACLNRMEEAERLTRAALALRPDDADALRSLGQIRLKQGDCAAGWPAYDHIHRMDISTPRVFSRPRWDGSDLTGKTILIHAQFGLGDTLQFARYLPLVQARGGRVLFECPHELAGLLQNSAGFDEMIVRTPASGQRVPDACFDVQFNLMSLAALFGSDDATIPNAAPYVHADTARRERWQTRIETLRAPIENGLAGEPEGANARRLVIGVVWAASTEGLRSCRAIDFAPLADLPNVTLVSLQKGLEAAQARDLPPAMRLHDLAPDIRDFADTAAICANLDLVISVDTSVAHLAGAMGLPTWTLLPCGADWRWQMERSDTPWYPSMRLFRQPRPGDWPGVLAQVMDALRRW